MKILQIQGQVEGGGAERHTFILSKALRDRGHDVVLLVPDTPHRMIDEMIEDGFVVERFPFVPVWRRIVNVSGGMLVKRVIEKHDIDLVHTHIFNADVMGLIGGRLAGVPVVTTMHGATLGPHLERTLVLRTFLTIMSLVFAWMDARIAISPFVKRYVAKDTGVKESSIDVVYNCSDVSVYDRAFDEAAMRADVGVTEDQTVVLCLGVLNPQKRTSIFVDLAIEIAPERPETVFLLAGLGNLRETFEARIAAAGLEERIRFLGHRHDVPELLSVTDLLVFPAANEGFGRAMTEAMSSSVPVVAFDSGACGDVIEDGVSGFVVEDEDVPALVARSLELIDDPAKRARMGAAGLARARALFDVPAFAAATEKVLERVLAQRRPKRSATNRE